MTRKRYTYQDVKELIESADYELLSTEEEIINDKGYILTKTYIKVKCNKSHEYNVVFNKFQQGRRCPYCQNKIPLTHKEVKEYVESFGYKLLSDKYENGRRKILIKCPNPNHEPYEVRFSAFKNQGQRCPYCANNIKYSYEYVKNKIEKENYKLLSVYNGTKEHLKLQCPNGHIWSKCRFSDFKRGYRCPYCHVSKGEKRIMDWLEENNINYIYDEPYFKDLLSPLGNSLRPDFIIEDRKIWIEYDGEFHYKKQYENDYHEQTIIHDEIKNQYAKDNGWKLIRIPYWDYDNIEEILKLELK